MASTVASSKTGTGTLPSKGLMRSVVDHMMMEAEEKCEEIDVKCEEEYRVLRRKEIAEQSYIIEKADKKRRIAVLRDDRVCYTKLVNNSRLAQLKAKNDIYNQIVAEIKWRVEKDTGNKYSQLLKSSLTQALFALMEPDVKIGCRKKDQNLIRSCFESAAKTYEKNTNLSIKICFSNKTLPDKQSSGGMIVSNKNEKVSVNCLLNSRVDDVCRLAMPLVVEMLFSGVKPITKDSPKLVLGKQLSEEDPAVRLLQSPSGANDQRKSLKPSSSSKSAVQTVLEEQPHDNPQNKAESSNSSQHERESTARSSGPKNASPTETTTTSELEEQKSSRTSTSSQSSPTKHPS